MLSVGWLFIIGAYPKYLWRISIYVVVCLFLCILVEDGFVIIHLIFLHKAGFDIHCIRTALMYPVTLSYYYFALEVDLFVLDCWLFLSYTLLSYGLNIPGKG